MEYKIKSKVWLWLSSSGSTKGAWHFVTVPPEVSEKIKKKYKGMLRGWASLPVKATFPGKIILETSIFPNNKNKNVFTYFLPIKKSVRQEVGIQDGDIIEFVMEIKF